MRKTWMSSVVAGLLILAPVAAVAQSGLGDEPEETEVREVALESSEAVSDAEVDTLALVAETETDDVGVGENPAGESNDHGERVSTVARCAPTGQLDVEGFGNHGAFVRAVAHGDTVTVEGTEYDLSTSDGVEALCVWAESYEPPAEATAGDDGGTDGDVTARSHGDRGVPAHAGKPDHAGKPAHAGKPDHAGTGASTNGHGSGKAKKGR